MTDVVADYSAAVREAWNALNRQAVNGHFLFDRGFMEYHADRFQDASLTVASDSALRAIFPANRDGPTVISHQGLTFGGLVVPAMPTVSVMQLLEACAEHWRRAGATTLVYKALPTIYQAAPASGDAYWLFRRDARLIRRDVTTTIDYRARGQIGSRRRRGIKRAAKECLRYRPSHRWALYWDVLAGVLATRHGVAPVHSLDEITLLAKRFPDHIQLYTAEREDEIMAGVVMFVTPMVAHAQYIAVSPAGREIGALDGLFDYLIDLFAPLVRCFDFGISTESAGRVLNEGLIGQKEEFGGGPVCHDVYELVL